MSQHTHYHKGVSHLQTIDVYRVLDLYGVTHPAIQHAVKKLLCAGQRGAKDYERDLREAHDSIARALQMIAEDCNGKTEAGMAVLCTKLKACEHKSDQRGWPGIPEAAEQVSAQAALMTTQEE